MKSSSVPKVLCEAIWSQHKLGGGGGGGGAAGIVSSFNNWTELKLW